jgi:very-short-patch-repair endonuclease
VSDVTLTESWLPITTVLRTLVDAGAVVDANMVERALECGLRRGDITVAQAYAAAKRLQARGRRGPNVLLEVLGRRAPEAPPTGSDLETCLLQLTRRAHLPDPVRQQLLTVDGRIILLDFSWPSCRYALEADGAETHGNRQALWGDLDRQNQIVLGWLLQRFTWEHVYLYPDGVVELMRRTWLFLQTGPTPAQLTHWQGRAGGWRHFG